MAKLPDDSTIVAVVDCSNVSHLNFKSEVDGKLFSFPVLRSDRAASDQRKDFELEDPLVVELEQVRLHIHQSRLHLLSIDS